jgi:hypothetical protein
LIHPVLNLWNEVMQKCVPSLRDEDHVEITIDHISLSDCLKVGYTITKTHCLLEYPYIESLWKDSTMRGVVEKTINSKEAPADKQRFIEKWDSAFNGMGQLFEERWDKWGVNPAKKMGAKIGVNSLWGKQAECVDRPNTEIFDVIHNRSAYEDKWENINRKHFSFCSSSVFSEDGNLLMLKTKNNNAKPNLHCNYLPAALMIPAYGRSQLWNQMHLLGDRVLMCDTDSIVYIYDPDANYNIKTGTMLGEWEEEECSIIGIKEFVGWGPKTYALKLVDDSTIVKAKGISLNWGTENLFNFETMKNGVMEFLKDGEMSSIFIPQFTFEWSLHTIMQTVYSNKEAKINKHDLKGVLKGAYLYPFGYEF